MVFWVELVQPVFSVEDVLDACAEDLPGVSPVEPTHVRPEALQDIGVEDEFVRPYMGRFYGRDSWEILSTGIEDVFYGKYRLDELDPEHHDFVLGVLASQ